MEIPELKMLVEKTGMTNGEVERFLKIGQSNLVKALKGHRKLAGKKANILRRYVKKLEADKKKLNKFDLCKTTTP